MEGEPGARGGGGGGGGDEGRKDRDERKRRRSGAEEEGAPSQPNRHDRASSLAVCDDDHSSVGGLDVVDRLTYLEQRMQMQEDELQLLKITLADVLKRLNISEEQQAAGRKTQPGVKARPASLALPSKPSSPSNPSTTSQKKSATLPPGPTGKNYTTSPTSTKSTVKSPTGSVKDTPCSSKTTRARPSSATPSCKKHQESGSKAKEPAVSVGSRRVTHCKDLSEPPHKKDWVF